MYNISDTSNISTVYAVEYTTIAVAVRSTVVLFVSLTIILSNLINFIVLRATKQMSPVTNIFLTNLTTADFCAGLIACLPSIAPAITGTWSYGAIWCQVSGIAHGSSCAVSIWSVGVIGVERYIATRHPLFYRQKLTSRTCLLVVASLWTLAVLTFLTPNMTKADFLYFRFQADISMCGLYWEAEWLCIATGFMIPVLSGSVIIFTTASVAKALKQAKSAKSRPGDSMTMEASLRQRSSSSREERAVRLLIVTTGLYFMTWGPYSTMAILEAFSPNIRSPGWLAFTLMWIANSNCFVNVIIYSAIYPSFKFQLKRLLYAFFCCGCLRPGSRVEPWSTSGSHTTPRDRY